jgi:2-iminobutanoate/2-iminopropanoate deaminase
VSAEYFPMPGGSKLPFSEAVRVGNTLYLAGAMGFDMSTMLLVPGGVEAETRKALENIRATLERHGSSLDKVVKATVFLADMSEWEKMNAVYVTYFTKQLPARSAFGGVVLAKGGRVEIECIATVD